MGLIREWMGEFLKAHTDRFQPHDWPEVGSPAMATFVNDWIAVFATRSVSKAEALRASQDLVTDPPEFRRQHIPAVLKAVEARREREGTSKSLDPREAAIAASRGCGKCADGDPGDMPPDRPAVKTFGPPAGFAVRWHPRPDPERGIGPTVQCYCTCPYGRWLKKTHAEQSPHLLKCFGDLADEEAGRAWWLDLPPDGYTLGGYPIGHVPPKPAWLEAPQGTPARPPVPPAVPVEQARQWAASPDRILAAEGARALAEAGVPEDGPGVSQETPPAPGPTPGPSGRPRPSPPWLGPSSAMASGDDQF